MRQRQADKLRRLRQTRDSRLAGETLNALGHAARGTENLMPFILDCVRAYVTLGEICDTLRGVFGTYQEASIL